MAVCPLRLNGISSHFSESQELEGLRRKRFWGVLVNVSHDIHFAFAARARAMPAQFFKGDITLVPVIPFDGKLVSNLLNIDWDHKNGQYNEANALAHRPQY